MRASDLAGKQSPTPTDTNLDNNVNWDLTAAYTFVYDNAPPITKVTFPPRYTNIRPATITGTSDDTYEGAGGRDPSLVSDIISPIGMHVW